MIYEDTVERSTDYLRQAVPLMSKQDAALHPVSYAVWYDYVANRNAELRRAVDAYLARDGRLDEASTTLLYRRHVAEIDPQSSQKLADGFNRLLSGMAESAAEAGDQTARFGSSLDRLSAQLSRGATAQPEGPALSETLDETLEGTRRMRAAMAQLQNRLEDSQREIALLREEVRRARHESLLDSLTGLANRRAFDQRLSACVAAAQVVGGAGDGPCLVVSDIDHFKRINDSYGHHFGDQVLRAVGQVLKALAPGEGMAARIGGEEFAILLPASALGEAQRLAEKIRHAVSAARIKRHDTQETLSRVTLSLGVTLLHAGESVRDFLERADKAMYASKSGGRDRVTVVPA